MPDQFWINLLPVLLVNIVLKQSLFLILIIDEGKTYLYEILNGSRHEVISL